MNTKPLARHLSRICTSIALAIARREEVTEVTLESQEKLESQETPWRYLERATMVGLAILLTICFAMASHAATLTEGDVLPNYAVVSVGSGASINVNSGPINGSLLIGDGSTATAAGGNNGAITGGVFLSPPCPSCNLSGLNTPPTVTTVASSVGTTAFSDAAALSAAASALTPSTSLGSISNTTVNIVGNGGLNVYSIPSGNQTNPTIHLSGGPNDLFVFNVAGLISTNTTWTFTGVSASQILWNFTSTTGNCFATSGGNVVFGTFLATDGCNFQFSHLNIDGQLINTDGNIQFNSGSALTTFDPFVGTPAAIPEPGTLAMMGLGVTLCGALRRKRRAARTRRE